MWTCPNDQNHKQFREIRTRTLSVLITPWGERVRDLEQHYEEGVDVPVCAECGIDAAYPEGEGDE